MSRGGGTAQELEVPRRAAGQRLDHFLAGPLGSRARAQRLIDERRVLVDGRPQPKRHRLLGGERVLVEEWPPTDIGPPLDAEIPVVWEDDRLLVVDKPAGLVVHPGAGVSGPTLVDLLTGRVAGGADPTRPGIVHRLDRDTSGLLVVAKDDDAHRRLQAALAERTLRREYRALVDGRPPARTGTIDAPVGRDRRDRTRISTDAEHGRPAVTHFVLERALPAASLLCLVLDTGRTHQIRVHLQAIGYPVCGDPQYGRAGAFGLRRQFLHASRLVVPHPGDGRLVEVVSPLPTDLERALREASRARRDDGR